MSTETAQEFAANLSRLINGQDVRISDLAKQVLVNLVTSGVAIDQAPSDQTIRNWVNKKTTEPEKANLDWCISIAEVLGVNLADLHPVLATRGKLRQEALAKRLYHKAAGQAA